MTALTEYIKSFPIPLPSAFLQAMRIVHQTAEDLGTSWGKVCDLAFGFFPVPAQRNYTQTPPEMVPFGRSGVDGTHYGFIVHAPELTADDHPVGELCPMDGDGVIRLGGSTVEALKSLLVFELRLASKAGQSPAILASVTSRLGWDISGDNISRRYDAQGNGLPIVPVVPEGWHYQPSSDGIGVLAPSAMFDPRAEYQPRYVDSDAVESWLARAASAMDSGFHATELFYLREVYWYHWADIETRRVVSERLAQVYEALDRPILAAATQQRV